MEDILDIALYDSDVNDDDLDDWLVVNVFDGNLGYRADLYGRFSLNNISEIEAKQMFRFEKRHIPRLARALALPEHFTTPANITISGVDALCILLRRLAYPNRLVDLEYIFGYSYVALSTIITMVLQEIDANNGGLLHHLRNNTWLTQQKLEQYSQAIQNKGAPMNNLWGFIDGTIRPICRPSVNQRMYYSGHKRTHCVKYQSFLCPDGIVVSLKGAFPGSRHDAGIFRESNLYAELEHGRFNNYVIYGDQGYDLRELILRPFTQNEIAGNPERQEFNNIMSALRVTVEWGFNKIIKEFAFLDLKKKLKLLLQEVGTLYSVGMILTNCHTCLYGSQQSSYFNIEPPLLEEYLSNY